MYTKEIKSLQHPIVKHLVKLRTSRRYREECGHLLLEGKKMIEEYQGPIKTLLMTTKSPPTSIKTKCFCQVSQAVLEKISATPSPEPLLAEVILPPQGTLAGKSPLLALNGVSDPGNLGTLIRTALAMNFKGVFLTTGTTDPYATKAMRAAKGASLLLPIQTGSQEELLTLIQENQLTPYVADAKGTSLQTFQSPLILILGNESHGPSSTLKNHAQLLSIPISNKTESLNVAIAGSILMYKIRETLWPNSTNI
jgi:RNA methyltransferase, TrmH family